MIALSDIFRNSDGTAEITLMEEQTLSIAGSLFNASAMDTLLGLLAGGWRGAPPFHISSTQFSGLELSIFVVLESSAIPLVDSIAIRWDSAEFVRKLGICAWIDEMRPTPALKNFVLQLPFWHVAPPSLQTVRSAPNYKPVGGDTHISFDESQHHSPTPASVATLFKAVGGIQTLSLSDEPPLHEVSPPYKAEVPWARPSSPEPSSGHANQRKQESHFTGSGFTERTPLEYVPGRRMMVPP
ncbi:hypothetical protein DI09_10p120 [Mitosporidium daphniae]|uniref:Uncharacterized protein n=1 Tax=Mitosporidium daphniae TaxID=1485682 RepID=A0A098VW12_9MICR|nr:uncharacterized protein DI09_10p120 [Mitosporidium daphniae]KGG53115.1 hypothetical protein DI09_10p120 [Mitosporidium daphniae]|eukprot:XP_013239542.1 uncharacterized protein DI09_10p120 [Mitosporidium daphniae]